MRMSSCLLCVLAASACALAVGGCAAWTDYADVAPGPGRQERLEAAVWRDQLERSPLRVEVSAEPMVLRRGESMTVTTTLVNELDVPVGVQFATGCTSGWSLWDGRDRVASSERPCTMSPVTRVYAPGRSPAHEFTWVWDREWLGPGTYRFVAGLGADGTMDAGEVVITLVD